MILPSLQLTRFTPMAQTRACGIGWNGSESQPVWQLCRSSRDRSIMSWAGPKALQSPQLPNNVDIRSSLSFEKIQMPGSRCTNTGVFSQEAAASS